MWYLGSEMAPLSLFSSKVSDDEKKSIVEAMTLSGDDCSVIGINCPVVECTEKRPTEILLWFRFRRRKLANDLFRHSFGFGRRQKVTFRFSFGFGRN